MDAKKQLRLKFRQWMKDNVTPEQSLSCGKAVCKTIQSVFVKNPNRPLSVSIFISKFPEISTASLIDHLYSIGAEVFIPAWQSEEMWMCHVKSKDDFNKLLKDTPLNKIPMPQYNRVPIEVHEIYSDLLFTCVM